MAKRITSQKIFELEKSIAWARALSLTISALSDEGEIDPISKQICSTVARHHWLPTCLLALTCCRFADIKQIQLWKVLENQPQYFREAKTSTQRAIPNLWLIDDELKKSLEPDAQIMHSEYNSLRSAIQLATPRHVRELLIVNNDSTHIFRHLRASWFYSLGWKVSDIQEFFSHKTEKPTREYIHEELFPAQPQPTQ